MSEITISNRIACVAASFAKFSLLFETKLKTGATFLAIASVGGCAIAQIPPSDAVAARYGRYCEQLGNLKDSPQYTQCLIRQRDLYQ